MRLDSCQELHSAAGECLAGDIPFSRSIGSGCGENGKEDSPGRRYKPPSGRKALCRVTYSVKPALTNKTSLPTDTRAARIPEARREIATPSAMDLASEYLMTSQHVELLRVSHLKSSTQECIYESMCSTIIANKSARSGLGMYLVRIKPYISGFIGVLRDKCFPGVRDMFGQLQT